MADILVNDLKDKGFNVDQINQLIKFDSEGFKFINIIEPTISAGNIRFLRKVYRTGKFSDVVFNKLISKLANGIDFTRFFDENYQTIYSSSQLYILCKCIEYNLNNDPKDFSKIENPSFNAEQMDILRDVIISSSKINYKLFDSSIPSDNMKLIASALKDGIDDDCFYNFDFSKEQLSALIRAKKEGCNLKYIANPNMDVEGMEILIAAVKDNVDISKISSEYYSTKDLELLVHASYKKMDLTYLLDFNLSYLQRKEIYNGLKEKIDVSLYADKKFTPEQMKIIELFLENKLDPTIILDETITSERMFVIYSAIINNFDYLTLLNKDITDEEAKMIMSLMNKGYKINK